MAAIGTVVDGKYEILKLVGKGGMSKVYLAMDKRLNKSWAIKEIQKNARDKNNAVVVQSAIAEANMIKSLDHPTLPRIVDIIDNGNVIYIVMDYIEGESLNKVLEREGAQPQDRVIEWAKELCEVLGYLHSRNPKIIYRDMKPANVMLKPDGSLKLIDFGIAREYKEQNIEDTVSLGTKGYAAPEQFGGKGQTDERTDIYCLGVTLYHLVTGQNPCEPPYEIYPIRHWNPALSSGLEAIIQKCTQLNPADRYQSCAELMYALEHYDEFDISYRLEQKKKLNKFIGFGGATLGCILIACIMLLVNGLNVNNNYKNFVVQASNTELFYETSNNSQDIGNGAVNQYAAAIELKPSNLSDVGDYENPYFAIIDKCCKECDVADPEELDKAINVVFDKENSLKNEKRFSELSYKIAEYYLYYAPNIIESKQISLAKHWLEYASADKDNIYYDTAVLMNNLVLFYDDVNELSKHDNGSDINKLMLEFSKNIEAAHNSTDQTVKQDVYRLSLITLANAAGYLNNNNYTRSEIEGYVEVILEDSKSFSKDKQQEINEYYKQFQSKLDVEFA